MEDTSGAVLPGATVTISNSNTGFQRTVVCGADGTYLIPAVPAGGPYQMTFALDGFKTRAQEGVRTEVGQNQRVDAALEIGAISEQILVTADALRVDTNSASVGVVIDSDRLEKLPMVGRGVLQLALLSPGVGAATLPPTVANQRNGPTLSSGGARTNQNNVMLDGASLRTAAFNVAQSLPSPDSLQEFQVLTSTYSAEYGDAGGATLMAITKSGTNEFRGSAWEYFRSDSLNATNFFAPTKQELNQNQFGGAFGGPVLTNRTFFFSNYEGMRIRTQQINRFFSPTAAQRKGDFSALSTPIRDPLTGQPFPGNIIPTNRLDPMAQNILNTYVPLPNFGATEVNNLVDRPTDSHQVTLKVDHRFSDASNMNVRFYRNRTVSVLGGGSIDELADDQANVVQTTTGAHTAVFNPRLVGEGRLSYTTITTDGFVSPYNKGPEDLGALWKRNGSAPLVPQINVNGGFTMSTNQQDWFERSRLTQADYKMTWTPSRHSVTFGGGAIFQLDRLDVPFQTSGVFTFTGTNSGNPLADYMLGRPATFSQYSQFDSQQTQALGSVFFQDDVKLGRVTVNLGVRYDGIGTPWTERDLNSATLRIGQQSTRFPNAPLGLVAPGDAGVADTIIEPDRNNVSPRVGFAWDVRGNGRSAVRGGYGIYYLPMPAQAIEQQNELPPYTQNVSTNPTNQMYDIYRGTQQPFPFVYDENQEPKRFAVPTQMFAYDPNFRSAYMEQFNVNFQQQVGRDIIVQAGYYGTRGHKLLYAREGNAAVYGPGATLGNAQSRRPIYPDLYTGISMFYSDAKSDYNSLQLTATKRYADGYTLQMTYALSESKDNRSVSSLGGSAQDPNNPFDGEWGLSDFNQRHILRVNGLWEMPFFRTTPVWKHVVGGWRLAGIMSKTSGQPINLSSGADVALIGPSRALGVQRPDLVPGQNPELSGDRSREQKIAEYFNKAAFVRPQTGTFGNFGRNVLIGPGAFTVDMSLTKRFEPWGQSAKNFEFRLEVFNLLNTVNLGQPIVAMNSANFGQINTAGDPRIVQLGFRFGF